MCLEEQTRTYTTYNDEGISNHPFTYWVKSIKESHCLQYLVGWYTPCVLANKLLPFACQPVLVLLLLLLYRPYGQG